MLPRFMRGPLLEALGDTPLVFLHGARQSGKTTLARAVAATDHRAEYLTLDEVTLRTAATADPAGFVRGLPTPLVLDEVQLVPDLFRALKAEVDRDRRPGRFLLTGSAHLLVLPQLSDAMVGRMEIITLRPLAQAEIEGGRGDVVDHLFSKPAEPEARLTFPCPRDELVDRLLRGGFPEPSSRSRFDRRGVWFESYISTLLQRDVRELANIDAVVELLRLLRLVAARAGTLLNVSELARSSGLPQTTTRRYLGLLEGVFAMERIPAWSTNLSKRLVRTPKVALLDSGLASHLLGFDARLLADSPDRLGPLLEIFVLQELRKQGSWSRVRPRFFHYRSQGGLEVDFLMEDAAGRVVGVEVKSRSTVTRRDLRGLQGLRKQLGDRFVRGVVFYTGETVVPFGDQLYAFPIAWLWSAVDDEDREEPK